MALNGRVLLLLAFCALLSVVSCAAIDKPSNRTPYFVLAGDSTTAPIKNLSGGWGDGFLARLQSPAAGINLGHNGATTKSFRPDWKNVIAQVKKNAPSKAVYVTIQFGHNDQKPANGVSTSEYQTNLINFTMDVRAAGGTPLLLTPLSRRSFKNGKVVESLKEQAEITRAAAKASDTVLLDLNEKSTEHLNKVGEAAAQKYNAGGTDQTHLNAQGTAFFGKVVEDLLVDALPDLERAFK